MEDREHYYLIMGEVTFVPPGKKQEVATARMNAFITCPEQSIPLKAIGRAQRAIQIQLHRKLSKTLPAPPLVVDAVIHTLTYLGHFTKEEFRAGVEIEGEEAPKEEETPPEKPPVLPS